MTGEYQLISMIKELSEKRKEYEKVADAVQSVEMKGYGVVSPKLSDIKMDDPVLIKHGNKFGVKIKAVAPSDSLYQRGTEHRRWSLGNQHFWKIHWRTDGRRYPQQDWHDG